MKIIRIDTLPLNNKIEFQNDYCSKIVYSSVCDPLFRYNANTKQIEKNACKEYEANSEKTIWKIKIRDDLFFYNGEKVLARYYYNYISEVINKKCYVGFLLNNVSKIDYNGEDCLVFFLKHSDQYFYKKLSVYNIVPRKDELTAGPYYIVETNKNNVIVKRNKYFRNKIKNVCNELLCFEVSRNYRKDIKLYKNKMLNITNNTMFPYEFISKYQKELIIQMNYIFMTFDFSPNYLSETSLQIRTVIRDIINKNSIKGILYNGVNIANSLFVDYNDLEEKNEKFTKYNIKYKEHYTLGYDNYYPNKIVAKKIANQLKMNGIEIKLIKNEYGKTNNNDFNIALHFMPYIDNESLYTSYYFKIIGGIKYKKLIEDYGKSGQIEDLIKMKEEVYSKVYQIPLFSMNSIYFIDKQMSMFNFEEFNYDSL